jgi:hypothetical protein
MKGEELTVSIVNSFCLSSKSGDDDDVFNISIAGSKLELTDGKNSSY